MQLPPRSVAAATPKRTRFGALLDHGPAGTWAWEEDTIVNVMMERHPQLARIGRAEVRDHKRLPALDALFSTRYRPHCMNGF